MMTRREALTMLAGAALYAEAKPDFKLEIGSVSVDLDDRHTIKTTGYNGTAPGPLMRFKEGSLVTVEVHNATSQPEIVHWHGLKIPSAVDGAMEEGTPMISPGETRQYSFTATPAGTRWYHTHVMAGRNLKKGLYTGQFGFLCIDPRQDAGRYDQEVMLALREWDPFLSTGGEDEGSMDAMWKYFSINGRMLGAVDPVRVRQGHRVLLRILNASATMHRRIAFAGHSFVVVALDGNPVKRQARVSALDLGPAERIDAIVEMNNPGCWILGATSDHDRKNGMGIVFEYSGMAGEPQWTAPSDQLWDYKQFGESPTVELPPAEPLPLVFRKIFAGNRWVDKWSINGKSWPKGEPIRIRVNNRYRLLFDNQSDEAHPVHLHRHSFELTKINGLPTAGVHKDVVVVQPKTQVEALLLADNPGPTLFHCHQQMHMDYGFMALFQYVQT